MFISLTTGLRLEPLNLGPKRFVPLVPGVNCESTFKCLGTRANASVCLCLCKQQQYQLLYCIVSIVIEDDIIFQRQSHYRDKVSVSIAAAMNGPSLNSFYFASTSVYQLIGFFCVFHPVTQGLNPQQAMYAQFFGDFFAN